MDKPRSCRLPAKWTAYRPRRDWDEWVAILTAAGLLHTRLHDERHTAGTLLIGQDVHLRVVQEILGHTDIRVTQKYLHVSSATTRDAADRIGAALWPKDHDGSNRLPPSMAPGRIPVEDPPRPGAEPPRGIEPRTCSLRAKVVTSITWAKWLVMARLLSVGVRGCPPSATLIVTQFVTHSAVKAPEVSNQYCY
jgi:Phage integrase family